MVKNDGTVKIIWCSEKFVKRHVRYYEGPLCASFSYWHMSCYCYEDIHFTTSLLHKSSTCRGGFKDGRGERPPALPPLPLFLQSLVFRNHFEELQTMLFEAELVINNARLIYVYPNTIEICLTTSYLLFGRHLV